MRASFGSATPGQRECQRLCFPATCGTVDLQAIWYASSIVFAVTGDIRIRIALLTKSSHSDSG